MPQRRWIAALVAGCLVCCQHAAPTPVEERPRLASLRLEGNRHFASDTLEEGLASDLPGSWPWSPVAHFDARSFPGDLDRIVTFYRAHGYFDARIAETGVAAHDEHSVDVTLRIEEGEPFSVRTLAWEGTTELPAPLRAQLESAPALRVGQTFSQEGYEQTKGAVVSALQEAGYPQAAVAGEASVQRSAHAVDVRLRVTPGIPFRIGAVIISGNHLIPEDRIRRQLSHVLVAGTPFCPSAVDLAQERLREMGVFATTEVRAGEADPATATLPVVVTVVEAPLHSIRAGGGIGLDVEHEEAHVSAGYTDRDLLGRLGRLDFDNSFALEWLPNVFEPSFGAAEPAFRSTLKLTNPGLFGAGFDLETSLQGQREVEIGYGDWAIRGRVAVPMKLLHHLTATAAYNASVTFFDSGSSFNGLSLSPAALLELGDPNHSGPYVLSYLEETAALDFRDDPIDPHRGWHLRASAYESGGPLGGSFSDVRFLLDGRGYLPLGSRDVVALRIEVGELYTYGGTASPIEQRFFLGGLDSIRGYGSLRLSPMVRVNTCGVKVSNHSLCTTPANSIGIVDVPIGGNGMEASSIEVRHALNDTFAAVAFADVGEVTSGPLGPELALSGLAVTPGAGLRIHTPVGPIRIDLAYLLVDPPRPVTVATQTFGPQPSGNYPIPSTTAGAVDTCGWPLVPQSGWSGTTAAGQSIPFAQPSACRSAFLRNLALSVAIGEAF